MGRAFLVTGTDTGVGKTVVAGGLAVGFRRMELTPGVFKPVESGVAERPLDGVFLKKCSGTSRPLERVVPYTLEEPLAPAVAAERAGVEIDLAVLEEGFRDWLRTHPVTMVEGAGGLLVPIVGSFTYADLARWWDLPLLVVARPSLGTINHTLLTLEALKTRGIPVKGLVYNLFLAKDPFLAQESLRAITQRADIARTFTLPPLEGLSADKKLLEAARRFLLED